MTRGTTAFPILFLTILSLIVPTRSARAATFEPGYCSGGTLYDEVRREVDARIDGVTASDQTKSLWTLRGTDQAEWPWVRNPDVWSSRGTTSIDWTGLSPWNSGGGWYYAGTLVSPRHIIYANHYQIPVNHTVIFVDNSNNVVSRTLVASQSVPDTDITVGLLDSDVPESIAYYPVVASSTWEAYLHDGESSYYYDFPIVVFDAEDHAILHDTTKEYTYVSTATIHYESWSGNRAGFAEEIIGGDSGNPGFALIGGKPVLLFSHYSAIAGPSYGYYRDAINQVMTSLGGGYQLSDIDLSCFDAPLVAPQYQMGRIDSGSPVGTVVGTSSIKYNIDNATPYFSFLQGNDDGAFAIDSSTGVITVASSTLITAGNSFPRGITIGMAKGGPSGRLSTAGFGVHLRSYPSFNAPSFNFSIDENSATSTFLGRVQATDPENDALTHSIVSGNSGGAFSIDPSSGIIRVANPAAIDYESSDTFDLVVRSTESLTAQHFYTDVPVTVSVNDVTIVFPSLSFSMAVDEASSTGAVAGTVFASTTDSNIGEVRYSIINGNADGAFAISSSTGQVTVANGSVLDRTSAPVRNLIVAASNSTDPGTTLATVAAAISVGATQRPSVAFETTSSVLSEGSSVVLTVALSAPYAHDVTVAYSTHDGSAGAPRDYDAASGTLVIPAGQSTATLSLQTLSDSVSESDEAFTVTLTGPTRATLGASSTHTVTVKNVSVSTSAAASRRGGGGGGGGGGGSGSVSASVSASATTVTPQIAELIRMFVQMNPQLAALLGISTGTVSVTSASTGLPVSAAVPGSLSSCPDLEAGATGSCVRMLQEFLNAKGYVVSASGAGSKGQETTYFGPATTRALARFQGASGIAPASGYFGPKTRAAVNTAGY